MVFCVGKTYQQTVKKKRRKVYGIGKHEAI